MNIPDLTNAEPGDVYEDEYGQKWEVRQIALKPVAWMQLKSKPLRGHWKFGELDSRIWKGFEKVE